MDPKTKKGASRGTSLSRSSSQAMMPIKLPQPSLKGHAPLSKILEQRKTTREISEKELTPQLLSNLLWAACGINRKKGPFGIPGRTAGSASNSQEIDLYVAIESGIYLFDVSHHRLMPVISGDFRSLAIGQGQPDFPAKAPVHLIFVADVNKLSNTSGYQEPGLQDPEVQKSYYYVDTGLIAGNVYLFAASEGLASWFHNCNRHALAAILNLRPEQRVLFGQTVGYPSKKS